MFVIECSKDGSICELQDDEVVCDKKTVKIGHFVNFRYEGVMYKGKVHLFSSDRKAIADMYRSLTEREPQNSSTTKKTRKVKPSGQNLKYRNKKSMNPQPNLIDEQNAGLKKAEEAIKVKFEALINNTSRPTEFEENDDDDDQENDNDLFDELINEEDSEYDTNNNEKQLLASRKRRASSFSQQEGLEEDCQSPKRYRNEPSSSSSSYTQNNVQDNQGPSFRPRRSTRVNKNGAPNYVQEETPFLDEEEMQDDLIDSQSFSVNDRRDTRTYRPENKSRRTHVQNAVEASSTPEDPQDQPITSAESVPMEHETLFGKFCEGSVMIELTNGVYCKERTANYALEAGNPRQCCRRAMRGAFVMKALLYCNLSQKEARRPHECDDPTVCQRCLFKARCEADGLFSEGVLYGPAVRAIIAWAKEEGSQRSEWPKFSESSIRRGMSQNMQDVRDDYFRAEREGKVYKYELP